MAEGASDDIRTTCPECGHDRFHEGPHGGLSVNVKCAKCGECFCCAPGLPFDWQRIRDCGLYQKTPVTILALQAPLTSELFRPAKSAPH